jgi:hypothetical protein
VLTVAVLVPKQMDRVKQFCLSGVNFPLVCGSLAFLLCCVGCGGGHWYECTSKSASPILDLNFVIQQGLFSWTLANSDGSPLGAGECPGQNTAVPSCSFSWEETCGADGAMGDMLSEIGRTSCSGIHGAGAAMVIATMCVVVAWLMTILMYLGKEIPKIRRVDLVTAFLYNMCSLLLWIAHGQVSKGAVEGEIPMTPAMTVSLSSYGSTAGWAIFASLCSLAAGNGLVFMCKPAGTSGGTLKATTPYNQI